MSVAQALLLPVADRLALVPAQAAAFTKTMAQLFRVADHSVQVPPMSVMDKPEAPPSGDKHDYFSVPAYRTDGVRPDHTKLFGNGSERYDRTRMVSVLRNSTVLALASFFSPDAEAARAYGAHGARLVRTMFIDPATRVNPNLNFAQHPLKYAKANRPCPILGVGIIETKDLYYTLDAVRLLHRSAHLSDRDMASMRAWAADFLEWLLTSTCGHREALAVNNHFTYYALQVSAVAGFVGNFSVLADIESRLQERVPWQIRPDGRQLEEERRTLSQHYCAFNLQGWSILSRQYAALGVDVFAHRVGA